MFTAATGAVDQLHREFFADSGDYRQVWALDIERGEVFYLVEHGVDQKVRDACKRGALRCPLPDCPDSRFVAHGGDERRHHFAHRVAHAPHKSTTVWRAEAAAMLANWAKRYRGANVSTRELEDLTEVVIRSARSGLTLTLAVTYNRRHSPPWESFSDDGRQLILGHTRALLLPRRQAGASDRLWWCGEGRLLSDLLLHRDAAVAVNPERRLVATLLPIWKAREAGMLPATTGAAYPIACFVDELDRCTLERRGIATPAIRKLRERQDDPRTRRSARSPSRPTHVTDLAPRRAPAPVVPPPDFSKPEGPTDPRQREFLRRAAGKTDEERLALLREMFLPPTRGSDDP